MINPKKLTALYWAGMFLLLRKFYKYIQIITKCTPTITIKIQKRLTQIEVVVHRNNTTTKFWYLFRGIAKKSTLLITIGTNGYGHRFGIATDSQVAEKNGVVGLAVK